MATSRRDNYFRVARRDGEGDWVPLDFGMSPGARKVFAAHGSEDVSPVRYFNFDGRWLGRSPTTRTTPSWRELYYADGGLPDTATIDPEWGVGKVYYESSDDDRMYFPLRDIDSAVDVDAYPWPDVDADYRYAELPARVRAVQDVDLVAHVGLGISVFEQAWGLRGFEALMMDMALENAVADRLFDRVHQLAVACAERVAASGADVMPMGSDVATQRGPLLSPATWRRYVFPLMRDVIAAAKRVNPDILVDYHSCGNVETMIDGFIEAGIDILNPCQPEAMDIFALKRRYGDVLTFHGGIGVQSVLPFGTPDEVRDATRRTIETMGEGGGYICSTSHNVRPETPWENLIAFIETVREYGTPPPPPPQEPV